MADFANPAPEFRHSGKGHTLPEATQLDLLGENIAEEKR
jgi:hypothetical protein